MASSSPVALSNCLPDDVGFQADTEPRMGEPLQITATVQNRGQATCTVPNNGAVTFTAELQTSGGAYIGTSIVTAQAEPSAGAQVLNPGETITGTATWDMRADYFGSRRPIRPAPGAYSVTFDFAESRRVTIGMLVTSPRGPPPDQLCPRYCYMAVVANLDGRSSAGTFAVYSSEPAQPEPLNRPVWRARITLSTGPPIDVALSPYLAGGRSPEVIAVVDANGDGKDEVFLLIGGGASTDFVSIFGLVGRTLEPVRIVGSAPALGIDSFPLGGSATHEGGLECRVGPGGVRQLVARGWGTFGAPGTVDWVETVYRWAGLTLVKVSERKGTIPGDPFPFSDPHVTAGEELRC
jgi:hypothetical protein